MPTWFFIPFAIFFACCAGQFWVQARVRNALIDRHPEEFLKVERSSIFPSHGLQKFIRSGRHRELNDPELSKAVKNCRILFGIALLAWIFCGVAIFSSQ